VRKVHPGAKFDVPKAQLDACKTFLSHFQTLFTLNYDLLLYWTILHASPFRYYDGFGLGPQVDGFRTFAMGAHCNVYYVHGALHLFSDDQSSVQKRVVTDNTIIDDIENTIRNRRRLPLIVAEGSSTGKIAKINSIPYLRHCYNAIVGAVGSLFIFGHSASPNDEHIYRAICRSNLTKLFFCVHEPTTNVRELSERLASYFKERADLAIVYVNSGIANVWGRA
jgi:hypothetical protein